MVQLKNISALVRIMAWQQTSDWPLTEPIFTKFHDAITRPHWVKKKTLKGVNVALAKHKNRSLCQQFCQHSTPPMLTLQVPSPVCIWDTNLVIIVPADGPVPESARPTAVPGLTTKLDKLTPKLIRLSWFPVSFSDQMTFFHCCINETVSMMICPFQRIYLLFGVLCLL